MRISASLGIALALLASCQRSGSSSAPSSGPTVASAPAAPLAVATPQALSSPSSLSAPGSDDAEVDDIDKPDEDQFEIDADADWYIGYPPMKVTFTAHALNGTPPFTFTWTLGDGSPGATGDTVVHSYEKTGVYNALVVGRDAAGGIYPVTLMIGVVTREQYATEKGLDLSQLTSEPSPIATP
jgi:hypothetical protein